LAVLFWAVRNPGVQAALKAPLEWMQGFGPLAPVLFILAYAAACVLLVPGSLLTLGAGAVFGVVWGSVYVSIASTLGASLAFLAGRHLARNRIERRLAAYPAFAALDKVMARQGWKVILLLRLSPVIPFTLLNYALGLTQVRFREYVLASWMGMMPGTVLYVYLGSIAGEAARPSGKSAGEWALWIGGLVATLLVAVLLTRAARKELKRLTVEGQP
jgi:uncharacterized membrane protein YdjX (TVP38/TMEM64 family)